MSEYVYQAIDSYFTALEKLGSYSYRGVEKLLVLLFYWHLLYDDYRGYVSSDDYRAIEKALNCLYGTDCLIPYPDYLKMGKLRLGEFTELANRVKTLEGEDVANKERMTVDEGLIQTNTDNIATHEGRLDNHDTHFDTVDGRLDRHDTRLDNLDGDITSINNTLHDHGNRITTIENRNVIKSKDVVQSIADIVIPE